MDLSIVSDEVDQDLLTAESIELENYIQTHTYRLWRSLEILRSKLDLQRPVRVLELGAMPYSFTTMLKHFYPQVDLECINGHADPLGDSATGHGDLRSVHLHNDSISADFKFKVHILNLERDPFPFERDSFDAVLCMEVIEHLMYSPSHMLMETHRVLKSDGVFFLTTPNAVDLRKTMLHILNRPVGFPYSGYGVYGRHNREFTLPELKMLLESCGYAIQRSWLENIRHRRWNTFSQRILYGIHHLFTSIPLRYFEEKREYCFLLANPEGDPRLGLPEELYLFRRLYDQRPG